MKGEGEGGGGLQISEKLFILEVLHKLFHFELCALRWSIDLTQGVTEWEKKEKKCCKFCLHRSLEFAAIWPKSIFFLCFAIEKVHLLITTNISKHFYRYILCEGIFVYSDYNKIDFFEDFLEQKTMGNPKGTCMFIAKGMRERGLTKLNTIIKYLFQSMLYGPIESLITISNKTS